MRRSDMTNGRTEGPRARIVTLCGLAGFVVVGLVVLGLGRPAAASPEGLSLASGLPSSEASPLPLHSTPGLDAQTLEDWVQRYVEAGRVVGVAAAVVGPEGKEMAVAGQAKRGSQPSPNTLFEVGSITKVFTSIVLAELVADGLVELETPIGALIPQGFELAPQVAEITLLELSTHTSGLPRLPGGRGFAPFLLRPSDPYRGSTTEGLYRAIERLEEGDVRGRGSWRYSNLGPALLGHLLGEAAGTSWEELVHERILVPLGLERTLVGIPPGMGGAMAQGHRENLRPTGPWRMAAYAPSGGVVSSLSDMVRFLEAVMEAHEGPLAQTTREVWASVDDGSVGANGSGLGWIIQRDGDGRVIWHNGRTGGHYAFIGFDPDAGRGVVVLTNTSHQGDAFARSLLRQDPEVEPRSTGWLARALTAGLLVFSPLTLLVTSGRRRDGGDLRVERVGRIHLLDGALTSLLFLALAWRVGAWHTISIWVWWGTLGLTLAVLVRSLPHWKGRAWWASGSRYRNGQALLSLALVSGGLIWVMWFL